MLSGLFTLGRRILLALFTLHALELGTLLLLHLALTFGESGRASRHKIFLNDEARGPAGTASAGGRATRGNVAASGHERGNRIPHRASGDRIGRAMAQMRFK